MPTRIMAPKKERPEIAIEWRDVRIDIKVCGVDVPPEDRDFVTLFPDLDPKLVSRDQLDATRGMFRKKREKLQKFEYKLITHTTHKEILPKVLPKLTCDHCGKSFSRRSTLEQHLALHNNTNTDWEEIQDAALQDLEEAVAYAQLTEEVEYHHHHEAQRPGEEGVEEEEEEEVAAPPQKLIKSHQRIRNLPGTRHGCPHCSKSFGRVSLLNRHLKLHAGIKPFQCSVPVSIPPPPVPKPSPPPSSSLAVQCSKCDRRFAAKAHLDRHMPVHTTMVKPYSCHICGWRFHLLHNMQRHLVTHTKKHKNTAKNTAKKSKQPKPAALVPKLEIQQELVVNHIKEEDADIVETDIEGEQLDIKVEEGIEGQLLAVKEGGDASHGQQIENQASHGGGACREVDDVEGMEAEVPVTTSPEEMFISEVVDEIIDMSMISVEQRVVQCGTVGETEYAEQHELVESENDAIEAKDKTTDVTENNDRIRDINFNHDD